MGIRGRTFGGVGLAVIGAVAALVGASPALAFAPLPPGGQVNDDVAAGINPGLSVAGEDPTNADVVGGALTVGKVAVPWAIFRQSEAAGIIVWVNTLRAELMPELRPPVKQMWSLISQRGFPYADEEATSYAEMAGVPLSSNNVVFRVVPEGCDE